MRIVSRIPLTAALLALATTPALAQREAWQDRWYWGAQGGVYLFNPGSAWDQAWFAGGHWMITRSRAALYLAFDEIIFSDNTSTLVANGASPTGVSQVSFTRGQRVQAVIYAIPTDAALQIYLGGGFALHHLTDADTLNAGAASAAELAAAFQAIEEASSVAFLVFGGGFQWRFGRLAFFADYHYMPASDDFLIRSANHVFVGGLRFALTSSRTEIGTEQ
ncbi:MAG: hypothetical protein GTN78_00790 [Gemmatimonadales bacterium]|nr:hypothetical protein [Gemmatimonadales bacterium]NIN10078.1 hypothetical protein [Gemmatimonadales bacterium]NIQ98729.1 hypothetical protein [Gemmatimonadales bacterium]NIS63607.1 hypothetical protein [Gemmatimonadales bacterium]